MQGKTSWRRHHYCSADINHPDSPPAGEGVRRCHMSFREGHSARTGRDPGPPPYGVRDFHALLDLLVCTPALRPGGPGPSLAITTARTLQDGRRHLHGTRTKSRMTATCAAFPQYTSYSVRSLYPRFGGKRRLPRALHSCTPPLLTTIKGGDGLPFAQADRLSPIEGWKQVL